MNELIEKLKTIANELHNSTDKLRLVADNLDEIMRNVNGEGISKNDSIPTIVEKYIYEDFNKDKIGKLPTAKAEGL